MNELNTSLSLIELEGRVDEKIQKVYGTSPDNWNDLNIFQGNLINYGYWKEIPFQSGQLTVSQRIASALALYDQVAMHLEISEQDSVLEVGCGRGVGAAYIYEHYHPAQLTGIDIVPSQVQKAQELVGKLSFDTSFLKFLASQAEKTFLASHFFDKIYSVEMLQHVRSWGDFAIEARRILKKSGRMVIATYFPTGKVSTDELARLLPLIGDGLENPTPIQEVMQIFWDAGFNRIQPQAIGQDVFVGYDCWARQVGAENAFTYRYLEAYQKKMIDYYILVLSSGPTQGRGQNARDYSP